MFREQGQLETLPNNDFDLKYSLCQQLLNITKSRQSSLDEIHLLYQQNQILNNIKNQMEVKKANKLLKLAEGLEVDNLSVSTIIYKPERPSFKRPPINRSSRNLNKSYNQSFEASRAKINIDIESALIQIQQKCSQNTTCQIRQLIKKVNEMNTKVTEFQRVSTELQNARKNIQTYKIRQNQFERKLQSQKKIKSSLSSKQSQRILEKQKYISKCQTALVLNEKRIAQSLKRLATKESLIYKQQSDLTQQRKLVDEIWDNIVNKLESPTDTFKTDIYIKLKESLKRQRIIMIEESQELDKLHQSMNKMISQIEQTV